MGKNYVSPKHIKDKIEGINNFLDKFAEFIPKVHLNIRILSNIVRNDPELTLQYEKLSKQYDAENKQKILEEMEEVYEDNHNIRNQSQHHEYQYCYYKIVHYDKDLYEKQKSEYQKGLRKSKPDGRVECRVKAEELGFSDSIFIYEIYMHWIRTRDKLENTVFKFPFCAIVAYMCEDHGRRSLPAA